MHQANVRAAVFRRLTVKIDSLEERAETVPHPNDRDSDFVHLHETLKIPSAAGPGQESCHNIAIFAECNPRVISAGKGP
jgi:hypothetical protein